MPLVETIREYYKDPKNCRKFEEWKIEYLKQNPDAERGFLFGLCSNPLYYIYMDKLTEYLNFAKSIAEKSGEIMLKYFNKQAEHTYKGDKSIVTIADTEINSYVIEQVKKNYPTHAVMGEEESYGKSDHVWVCDPVDGTAQFSRGVPVSVFSLALVIDGVSTVAVIYDPFLKNMYHSIKGQGAYKNNDKLQVSDVKLDDKQAVVNLSIGTPRVKLDLNILDKIRNEKRVYCTSLGSIARAGMLVAEGHYVATIYPHDLGADGVAGIKLIVEEAGGFVSNCKGENERMDGRLTGAVVSNKVAFDEIISILK